MLRPHCGPTAPVWDGLWVEWAWWQGRGVCAWPEDLDSPNKDVLAPGLWAPRLPTKVSRDPVPAASSSDLWDAHLYCLCLSASLFHLPSVNCFLGSLPPLTTCRICLPGLCIRRNAWRCLLSVCLHWWAAPQPQEHPKSPKSDSLISLSDLNFHLEGTEQKALLNIRFSSNFLRL